MAISTTPTTTETLTQEQKANRELAASLLDAQRNLTQTLKEAEAKLAASKDQAIKDFSKATTADQVIARAKTLAAAVEQSEKDIAALKQVPKLIKERLQRLEKDDPDDVRAVCIERRKKLEEEIEKSESDQKPLEDELKQLNVEISKLKPSGHGTASKAKSTKKATASAVPASTGGGKS